jgi:hypothetical protein
MGFADQLQGFKDLVVARVQETHDAVTDAAFQSIVHGSSLTGAPGQPVATENGGKLRDSWTQEREGPARSIISTDVSYAPDIEDGVGPFGPIDLETPIGGFHSVALTCLGAQVLVDQAVSEVVQ